MAETQTTKSAMQLPEHWSAFFDEEKDTFDEFSSFDPANCPEPNTPGSPVRQLSSRQISGQFEEEVTKAWEEDWDDEDVDDTFDKTMERIARQPRVPAPASP